MSTVWITGACGFTGRHLCAWASALPDRPRLVGLSRRTDPPAGLDAFYSVDLTQTDELVELVRRDPPDMICHLAGALPPANAGELAVAHAMVTVSLLTALFRAGRSGTRVLGVGSAAEYLPPFEGPVSESHPVGGLTPYGQSKAAQSALTLSLGPRLGSHCLLVRPFNLVGPGMSSRLVLGALAQQFAQSDGELVLGNLDSVRDFLDVRDAAAALWGLMLQGMPGETYNLCSGSATSIRELVELLAERSGRQLTVRVDPQRLRPWDPPVVVGDGSRLAHLLNWTPTRPLRQSVDDVLAALAVSTTKERP